MSEAVDNLMRTACLRAAEAVALRGEDVTMERVAAETDLSRSTVFNLFGNRRDLLIGLNLHLARQCVAAAPRTATSEELLAFYCEWYGQRWPIVRLLVEGGAVPPPDAGELRSLLRDSLRRDGRSPALAEILMPVWHDQLRALALEGQPVQYDRHLAALVLPILGTRPIVRRVGRVEH